MWETRTSEIAIARQPSSDGIFSLRGSLPAATAVSDFGYSMEPDTDANYLYLDLNRGLSAILPREDGDEWLNGSFDYVPDLQGGHRLLF